jgi:MFS superfamily sulfate permease-like transporter
LRYSHHARRRLFTELLRNLPQPVLAAIVLMAVAGLVKVRELRHLWQVHRNEFLIAMVALLGVLWAGLLKGVLIGAIISLVLLIGRVSSPHVAFLGRIPGARHYSDLKRHADNEPTPECSPSASNQALFISTLNTSSTPCSRVSTARANRSDWSSAISRRRQISTGDR